MLKQFAAVALVFAASAPAFASSDDAWKEFAAEVETGCLAATSDTLKDATAVVDPFGSESYGLAVVSGIAGTDTQVSMICVFDKETKAVEVGGELDLAGAVKR